MARYAERLQLVDGYLTHLMSLLDKDDVLVVMADHGNDPTIGHSQHTRECVPLLVWRPGVTGIRLGDRATLSDVGASVCEAFGAPAPQNGASFFSLLQGTHMTDRIEWLNASGYTYAHEHLHIDLSPFKHNDDCRLDDYALLRDEMKALMARGVRNIVEVTNRYMGRDVHFIARLMRDTGINVLLSTGYYQQDFYPEHVATRDAQTLAAEMIAEIECGVDGSGLRAGVIAEIGSSEGRITPDEAKMFHAAALAYHATGRPISTHTSFSTMGPEQLALLQSYGVPADRVVIGHCDLKDNLETVLHLIDQGAWVQFDTIGKNSYYPDEKRVAMLTALSQRGLLDRVMLSMDITRRSHLRGNGGPGFSYLLDSFVPLLLEAGIGQQAVTSMLQHNPNRFFK